MQCLKWPTLGELRCTCNPGSKNPICNVQNVCGRIGCGPLPPPLHSKGAGLRMLGFGVLARFNGQRTRLAFYGSLAFADCTYDRRSLHGAHART